MAFRSDCIQQLWSFGGKVRACVFGTVADTFFYSTTALKLIAWIAFSQYAEININTVMTHLFMGMDLTKGMINNTP